MNEKTIRPGTDTIDFNKLSIVVRNNWIWLLLIFVTINGIVILYLRYTKNLYESSSDLKLEVKNDATELGIKSVVDDPNVNLISGEIELIQSKLFLSQVLAEANLDVTYYSVGRVTNEELFRQSPFRVKYKTLNGAAFNSPIYFEEINDREYKIKLQPGEEKRGHYGKPLLFSSFEFIIDRNNSFQAGEEIGYFFTINSEESQLNYLTDNLTAEPINYNANTIRISFKDHNALKAQYVLNKIDTLYLQYSYDEKNQANKQKIKWLSNELAQIEGKMEGYEDYFENFTLQNKTNNLDEDLSKMILRINEIDSQRFHLTQKISRLNELTEGLESKTYLVSLTHRPYLPEQLNKNLDDVNRLFLEQEKLKMSYNEVTFAFRQKQKELDNILEKSVRQLEEVRTEAISRLQQLNDQKKRLEREFANLPDKNTEFSKNLRFYKLNEQLYLSLMQSKSQFEVVQAGSVPDFRILAPASFPVRPISPKKTMIYAVGFVGSLTFMLFFVGIMYLANNKITSLTELETTLQLPVVGVVPISQHIRADGLFVVDLPKSMVSEAIRTIRTNLDFFNNQSNKKVIAVSSTVSGEGKSFIATNLGAMIALSKKKVILLDLDMRKNKSNLPVAIKDRTKGISTVLIRRNQWEECVIKTEIPDYDYLPAGPHPPNPAELLLNDSFVELLQTLKQRYDYILMDTPPVGLVTDGIMAMKNADLCLYIFRANYSKKDFMLNLQRIININKFSNITMVLNALPSSGAHKYGYGYYEEAENKTTWKKIFNS